MRNITVKGVRKEFSAKVILANVNFTLSEGKKIALVGENGAGKSTLLKILCQHLKPDRGELFGLENGCVYIAQDFSGDDKETPFEFLSRRVSKIEKAIRLLEQSGFDLGIEKSNFYSMPCGLLSGGERKKLEIVAGLAGGALFIALDEPENHLDYQTIEWLLGKLRQFSGGLVFVSHDQYLIDSLADTIFELEDGSLMVYSMKYEEYLNEKDRQIAGQARQWTVEAKDIKRLKKTVEMMKLRAARNSDTAATYQQTKRKLREMEDKHGKKPSSEVERPKATLAKVQQKNSKNIVLVNDLFFSYESKKIFLGANADLSFGEKVVLFGPNGSGKSTLIKLITDELSPQKGEARIGVNVNWQMMTQDHLAGINPERSALEVITSVLHWPDHRCRACLAKYGIKSDSALKPLNKLSGGQRARFKLALIFAQDPEFLILDEPTNHVDPSTWEAIVESIKDYSGTVLAVTHDRLFIDAIAEKLWVIGDGSIKLVLGNLSDFLEKGG